MWKTVAYPDSRPALGRRWRFRWTGSANKQDANASTAPKSPRHLAPRQSLTYRLDYEEHGPQQTGGPVKTQLQILLNRADEARCVSGSKMYPATLHFSCFCFENHWGPKVWSNGLNLEFGLDSIMTPRHKITGYAIRPVCRYSDLWMCKIICKCVLTLHCKCICKSVNVFMNLQLNRRLRVTHYEWLIWLKHNDEPQPLTNLGVLVTLKCETNQVKPSNHSAYGISCSYGLSLYKR